MYSCFVILITSFLKDRQYEKNAFFKRVITFYFFIPYIFLSNSPMIPAQAQTKISAAAVNPQIASNT